VARLDNSLSPLLAATYLGGNEFSNKLYQNEDIAYCLAIDDDGNVWVAGRTHQPDFPVTQGSLDQTHNGGDDVFFSKLDPDLSRLFISTFIGGTYDGSGYGDDVPSAMALSADNSVLRVVGRTESENFPTTPNCFDSLIDVDGTVYRPAGVIERHDPANGDQEPSDYGDGFYMVLNGNLANLVYSTFIGGDSCEYLDAILINGDDIIVAGQTTSLVFPGITTDDVHQLYRGVLLRFRDETGETPPGGSNSNSVGGSSGGGGGGCFAQVTRR
jgi:hypothetical protein